MSTPPLNSPFPTLIIADDLTGACDTAVAFAPRGFPTRVLIESHLEPSGKPAVCAVSTGSRSLPPHDAEARLTAAARLAPGFPRIFKKIDSTFRGNTIREIALSLQLFPAPLAILAPAYPALGRGVVDGVIRVADLTGERTIDAVALLHASGLNAAVIPAGLSDAVLAQHIAAARRTSHLLFCDALHQSHLEAVARAAARLSHHVLWIGSGGLAHALAALEPLRPEPSLHPPPGRVVLFCGSDHPVSVAQLRHLGSSPDVATWTPGRPAPAELPQAACVLVPVACGTTRKSDLAAQAEHLRHGAVGCLLMTGGDTAALVCRALAVEAIELQREVLPGLPQGVLRGGPFSGCTVILKSGGFGEAATIGTIVEQFAPSREARVV
ncbi:MAG: four-carbon acid sugar kinase family protein [Acidobacteriaceae bacterium]